VSARLAFAALVVSAVAAAVAGKVARAVSAWQWGRHDRWWQRGHGDRTGGALSTGGAAIGCGVGVDAVASALPAAPLSAPALPAVPIRAMSSRVR